MSERTGAKPAIHLVLVGLAALAACDPRATDADAAETALIDARGALDAITVSDDVPSDRDTSRDDASEALDAVVPLDSSAIEDVTIAADVIETMDAHAAADASTAVDALVVADAPTTDALAAPDAALDCTIAATAGPRPGALTVEPCSFAEGALRGTARGTTALTAISAAPDGSVVVVIGGEVRRYTRDAAPGCLLTRDASFTVPGTTPFGGWVGAEHDDRGNLYVISPGGDLQVLGRAARRCAGAGLGSWSFAGAHSDGLVLINNHFAPAWVYDTLACTVSAATFGPSGVRGVARIDGDHVLLGESCEIVRARTDGTMVFRSTSCPGFGNDVTRCGNDICIAEGGAARLARFSGADGSLVRNYLIADLFGPEAPSRIARISGTPDGATLYAALELDHPSTACSAGRTKNVLVYRLHGF